MLHQEEPDTLLADRTSTVPITPAPRRFPDFLGIGVQKAGTTWWGGNLRCHPAVFMHQMKEFHYFNSIYIEQHRLWTYKHRRTSGLKALNSYVGRVSPEERDYRYVARLADFIAGPISDEWYGSMFSLADSDQTCGEITPEYCLLPNAGIEHILRLSPKVKILIALRDPIDRSCSQIRMMVQRVLEKGQKPNLDRLINYAELEHRANYPEIIARWTSLIPRERFLVVFADDVRSRPEEMMATVCRFLDIEYDIKHFPNLRTPVHVGESMEIPETVLGNLRTRLRPIYDELSIIYPEVAKQWTAKHYR